MTTLLIDAGNSRLKWGFHGDGKWMAKGFVLTGEALGLSGKLLGALPQAGQVDRVLVCSVAGEAVDTVIIATLPAGLASKAAWFRSGAETCCGVANRYVVRSRLGADRWAAAIGAWHRVQGDCLVVTAGTATTIDVVRALPQIQGGAAASEIAAVAEFAGGVIVPGMRLMQAALISNTAQLRETDGGMTDLPRTTEDAITTGCLEATLGAIERLRRRLPPATPLVLSGGAAPKLAPWLDGPVIAIDDLVLEGLAVAAREM